MTHAGPPHPTPGQGPDQAAGGAAPDQPENQPPPSQPQSQPQAHPQGQTQGQPQAHPQGQPQGQPQAHPQGRPQAHPQPYGAPRPGPAPYPYLSPPPPHPGHHTGLHPTLHPGHQAGAVPGTTPGSPVRHHRHPMPGWVWPVIAVGALVLGLVGGLLGGALVLGTRPASSGIQSAPEIGGAAAPLDATNHSVAAVAAKVVPSTVQVRVVDGTGAGAHGATGSGFVIDHQGHVITNNHVVEVALGDGTGTDLGKAKITVFDVSGRPHSATVVGRSPVYDVAVLKVDSVKGLPPAPLGLSRQMRVGQTVVAIGSPLGLSSTVTSGIVSALDRPVTTGSGTASSYIDAVQTDAAINPGNSGGPLVNMRGEVVGMNSAIATTGGTFGGEAGNIGVGFAIPMEQVRVTAQQILSTGKAEYPVIGANVNTADTTDGAQIVKVLTGTPADRAGLENGDRVVAVAGHRVTDGISLIVAIRAHRPGETLRFTVVRDGHERVVPITLDAKVG